MKLSEIIIRRQIRRILQEAVPTSTAVAGTFGYAANPRGGAKGSFERKIVLGVLGAIGARILYGILKGATTPEKEAKLSMKAVICGDSQGKGYLGNEVGKILSSQGYKVSNVSVNGAGPDAVLDQVKAHAKNAILVVAIFGGNTSSPDKSADGVVKMYEHCEQQGTAFMAIGPPPVTEITDSGEIAKRGDKNYWLSLSPSDIHSQGKRKEISDAMEAATSSSGEQINVYGVASNWRPKVEGGKYPDQPDGLHCQEGAAEVARAAMDALGIDNVTAQLKKELGVKQYDPDEIGMVGKNGEATPANFSKPKFRDGIGASEGSYTSVNTDPKAKTKALGRYQFLPSYHWKDIVAFAKKQGIDLGPSTKTNTDAGRADWDNFLNNPKLQDDYMDYFIDTNLIAASKGRANYDRSRSKDENISKLDFAQILAITHFNGAGGPRDVNARGLNSVPYDSQGPTPGNATYAEYLSRFNKKYYST